MIKSISGNDIQIYHLSAGKSLPEFLKDAEKGKSLKKNNDYKRRLELIQDFEFPISTTKVCISNDESYIGAVGVYPPEVKVFETDHLSLKFSRRFDSEVVDFLFLSDDYKKLVFLQADRSIEFHAQGGRYHKLRIPKFGRALRYLKDTAELLIVGSSEEIYRLDLEAGVFEAPILTNLKEINCCTSNPQFPIVFVGGSDGLIEAFDTRSWKSASRLSVVQPFDYTGNGASVTSMDVSQDGMMLCAGTSSGVCRLYDIRSSRPLTSRDHRNTLPIIDVKFIQKAIISKDMVSDVVATVASVDKKSVKLWEILNDHTTRSLASLEPETSQSDTYKSSNNRPGSSGAINGVSVFPRSGLLFIAQDNARIGTYFVPRLGLAPRWCSFLDSLTEEMEENAEETVYDDFQFVTKIQLQELGADHLIGTPLLRAYMHGYFMDAQLYNKLQVAAKPFEMEEFRKKQIQEKIIQKRSMRIQTKHKLPSVNKDFANKLRETAELEGKGSAVAKSILVDDRFAQLFTNPEFSIEALPISKQA